MSVGTLGYLAAPICDARAVLENGAVHFQSKSIEVVYVEQSVDVQGTEMIETPTTTSESPIPLPIHLAVDHLVVSSGAQQHVAFHNIVLHILPDTEHESVTSIELQCDYVKGEIPSSLTIACGKIQGSAKFHNGDISMDSTSPSLIIPGVGKLSSAELGVAELSDMSISKVGRLAKPMTDLRVAIKDDKASIQCNALHIECPGMANIGNADNGSFNTGQSSCTIPMELQVRVKRLIVMQEFGVGKQGALFRWTRDRLEAKSRNRRDCSN
jgi:hypothetical protein